jgi:hypothetical protein
MREVNDQETFILEKVTNCCSLGQNLIETEEFFCVCVCLMMFGLLVSPVIDSA